MKTNFFFKHDYNARTDPKLQEVIMSLGCEGIGIYWCIIEMLYEQDGIMELRSLKSIAFSLHVEYEKVMRLVNDFDLFERDEYCFWSDSVKRRINQRDDISDKRRNAIRARWDKQKNTNVSETDTNVLQKNDKADVFVEAYKPPQYRDYDDMKKQFFEAENHMRLQKLCRDNHCDIKTLVALAEQIINEWQLTEHTHKDYRDASQHLINLIRIKLNEASKKAAPASKKDEAAVITGTWSVAEEKAKQRASAERRKDCISREEYLKRKKEENGKNENK